VRALSLGEFAGHGGACQNSCQLKNGRVRRIVRHTLSKAPSLAAAFLSIERRADGSKAEHF
jgi:hypothetical protein